LMRSLGCDRHDRGVNIGGTAQASYPRVHLRDFAGLGHERNGL
jgi:hypothetical protein